MKTINFKGKGEHSVNELELIIEQQAEELHLIKSGQKQLILSGVSGMFSEEQMEEAWTNGCGCGETRSGYFDIENYS
tara:strand:+ start:575 stop:805 length:231 start_codon:yes stop_codon:yes gene_type:complete